jgi:hypothetical protein
VFGALDEPGVGELSEAFVKHAGRHTVTAVAKGAGTDWPIA